MTDQTEYSPSFKASTIQPDESTVVFEHILVNLIIVLGPNTGALQNQTKESEYCDHGTHWIVVVGVVVRRSEAHRNASPI